MTDHYRVDKEIILALMFVILLILFAGKNGMFAVLSFVITVLMIWKILVPCYLKGMNPMWVGNGHHGSVDCRNNISCIRR